MFSIIPGSNSKNECISKPSSFLISIIVKPYFSNFTIDNYGSISKSNYCFPLGLLKHLLINKKRDFPKIYFKEKKGFNYVKSFKFNDIEPFTGIVLFIFWDWINKFSPFPSI